jgi:hypothetical protein
VGHSCLRITVQYKHPWSECTSDACRKQVNPCLIVPPVWDAWTAVRTAKQAFCGVLFYFSVGSFDGIETHPIDPSRTEDI